MSSRIKVLVTKKQAKKLDDGNEVSYCKFVVRRGSRYYGTVRRCMIWNWNVSRTSLQITRISMVVPLNDLQMRCMKRRCEK